MFERGKIDLLYRLLCLLAFLIVIIFINSYVTVIIITISFFALTITERRVENIFLYVMTLIVFILCLVMKNYFLLRIVSCVDYIHYFINNEVFDEDEFKEEKGIIKRDTHYIRFKKNEERNVVSNNSLCTLFVVVHMVLLLIAIVVG